MSTIFRWVVFLTLFLVLAPTLAVGGTSSYLLSSSPSWVGSPQSANVTITVSGVVTGQGGSVPDVWVGVGSPLDWQETTTNASGFYSLPIQTDGQLWFHLRPDLSTRLAQVNLWMDGVATSFTQDFSLKDGYLLSLRPTLEGGTVAEGVGFEVAVLGAPLPEGQWYVLEWDQTSQRYQAVLHQDVHYVTVWNPPPGYYPTTQAIDLRTGDQTVDMPLNTSYVHPIPDEPPDADKITFGTPDGLGEVVVNGAPGAALPLAHVLLVNLNSSHQAHTISAADGSFSAQIFAPPGSAVMVKHGPADPWRWHALDTGLSEGVNPYPGTIVNLPHTHTGEGSELPFAAAGVVQHFIDDPAETRNYVSSAWAITGTLSPVFVPGEWQRLLDGFYAGEAVPGLYLGGLNWTHPALGDLDADGDLDLLVGERGGTLVYYRNQGNASFPDWTFEALDYADVNTGWWAYPALADVTADGSPDLFVGHGDGTVSVYFNAGTPASPSWTGSPDVSLSAGGGAAPALYDLDADGDLDLLVGHQGGTLFHFKNNGTASSPAWSLQSESYGGISEPGHGLQPSFVDLDSDGDQDLLIGRSGDLVWYRNQGPPSSPSWTRVEDGYMGFGGSSAVSPVSGDWGGDGGKDLITGEHWGVLRFFRNEGPPTWTEEDYAQPFDLQGGSAPALTDWDDDGDLDLLLGQTHGDVHQYTNQGNASSADWKPEGVLLTLPWTNHPHPFPTFADIDGDGDDDLFVGEGGWQGPGAGGGIHYYRNQGTASTPTWNLIDDNWLGLDVGGWSTPVFTDIDADNDLDLFVGDEEGTLTYLENTGTVTNPLWAAPVNTYAGLVLGAYSAPAFFDLDQDGDLDMLVGQEDGSLASVRNTGTPSSPAWELISSFHPEIDVGEHATPVAADIDGDGDADLLVGDEDGGLNVYLYTGPGTPPEQGDTYAPGDLLKIDGALRLYGPAINETTDPADITVNGSLGLMMLSDQDGNPLAARNYFMSTLLTPTGFPIQRPGRSSAGVEVGFSPENLHYLGGHAMEGNFSLSAQLPEGLPLGGYRPFLTMDFSGVPTSTQWLAANVVYNTFYPSEAALPPIGVSETASSVAEIPPQRLIWRLLMEDFSLGTRGAGARQDNGVFEIASQIVSQGAAYIVPAVDARTGQAIEYRLEPFLPMISFTDRRMPTPPLIPFDLPGGELCISIQEPDGTNRDLGCEAFSQSFNRSSTTRYGSDLNIGTVQLEDVYSLKAASNRFRSSFDQFGHHVVTMSGSVEDIWGNSYEGGGTYDLWVARPLDIDPGVLPGTPLAVEDAFNPALQFYPRVPAQVALDVVLYPDSDPSQAITRTVTGEANPYGYFSYDGVPITLDQAGEYRVDLTAVYTATNGELYMGSMTWGGVVMTPPNQADLIAHGRRGLDSLTSIPSHWFFSKNLDIPEGAVSHTFNPYYNGDLLWTRMSDGPFGGDSLVLAASVQDTVGTIEAAIQARAGRVNAEVAPPGDLEERISKGELPLFSSTTTGRPAQMEPGEIDQLAYSYQSSQRPGVRVREVVVEDAQSGGYWRLDTLYDDQLGVGIQGDQPNDFKFQYIGVVYHDLETGHSEYLGQGTGWVFIPESDPAGSRAMPPFSGPGNGGWTSDGGPILTLLGEEVHIFILPTGVRPGAVLQQGDQFHFAGHIMPTLNSQVAVTVTAPSGAEYIVGGQANAIGYFYEPEDDFPLNEVGLWSVDVRVWHAGQCSGGATVPPYPSGDVLGSQEGRYWFYVVPKNTARLNVASPTPGFLSIGDQVDALTIRGEVPLGLSAVSVDYTISMPGYILEHGQVTPSGRTYQISFDPAALHQDFPNLDLMGRDGGGPGLSDTFAIAILLVGQRGGQTEYHANTVTLQGEQVFVGDAPIEGVPTYWEFYLPLISQ